MNKEGLLIWWTDQSACEEAGKTMASRGLPKCVKNEFYSRSGRNGRGRLWVPEGIDLHEIDWPKKETPLSEFLGENCGGIVFHAKDFRKMKELPGIVTDCSFNILQGNLADETERRRMFLQKIEEQKTKDAQEFLKNLAIFEEKLVTLKLTALTPSGKEDNTNQKARKEYNELLGTNKLAVTILKMRGSTFLPLEANS